MPSRPPQWHHQYFQRGKPELLRLITRQPRKKPEKGKQQTAPAPVAVASAAAVSAPAASAPASSAATPLAGHPNTQIIEMLQRERESVEWMRHELASLEQQLKQAQKEGVPTPLTPSEPSHPFLVLLLMPTPLTPLASPSRRRRRSSASARTPR